MPSLQVGSPEQGRPSRSEGILPSHGTLERRSRSEGILPSIGIVECRGTAARALDPQRIPQGVNCLQAGCGFRFRLRFGNQRPQLIVFALRHLPRSQRLLQAEVQRGEGRGLAGRLLADPAATPRAKPTSSLK